CLKPERFRPNLDRFISNRRCVFRSPEDVDDVDVFGNVEERRVRLLAQHFLFARVYRDNMIAGALQLLHDAVRGFLGIRGGADHGDGLRTGEERADLLGRGIAMRHQAILFHHAADGTAWVVALVCSDIMSQAARYATTPITIPPGTM